MGIFDFFRKTNEDKKIEEIKHERVAMFEIGNWLETKKKDLKVKEKKLFTSIKERIETFTSELETKINAVKTFNVHVKKAEDKLKSATEEGRDKYLMAVSSLISNLDNLQEDKAEIVFSKIDRIFSEFNKNSHMSYERATILIGKEMADLRNNIKTFSKDIIHIFEENKELVDFSKAIILIELKLKKLEEIKKDEDRNNEKILSLDNEINEKQEENNKILKEIEKIKKSSEHSEYLKALDECKLLKEEIESDFTSLIQLIDFKALGNFYHILEDKIERVKAYRNEFKINFEKDNGREILELLNISKMNNEKISSKINEINSKKETLKDKIENSKDKTQELSSRINDISLNISQLKNLKIKDEKRLENFKITKEEITQELKKDFDKIGIELIN